jgi:hypothetical protein
MRSPSRVKEHQSGFPQIRQGLRRLTQHKIFEVDVRMASLPAAPFLIYLPFSGMNIADYFFFLCRFLCLPKL